MNPFYSCHSHCLVPIIWVFTVHLFLPQLFFVGVASCKIMLNLLPSDFCNIYNTTWCCLFAVSSYFTCLYIVQVCLDMTLATVNMRQSSVMLLRNQKVLCSYWGGVCFSVSFYLSFDIKYFFFHRCVIILYGVPILNIFICIFKIYIFLSIFYGLWGLPFLPFKQLIFSLQLSHFILLL